MSENYSLHIDEQGYVSSCTRCSSADVKTITYQVDYQNDGQPQQLCMFCYETTALSPYPRQNDSATVAMVQCLNLLHRELLKAIQEKAQ